MTRLGLACAKGRKIIKRPRTAIKCFSIALELCLGAEKCFYSERHKNKAMKASGQTALEYMLIIVVAIIVVVTLLIFMQGVSTSTISTNTKGLCEATRCKSDIDCVVDVCIPFATHCSPLGSCFIDAEFGGGSAGGGGGGAGSLSPEVDGDGDGIYDWNDNCPFVYNPDQDPEACEITVPGEDFTEEFGVCMQHFAPGNNLCEYYLPGTYGELVCIDGFVDDSNCSASNTNPVGEINGVCGDAATEYGSADEFPGGYDLCESGNADIEYPENSSLVPGGTVEWTCLGGSGGDDSYTCKATREEVQSSPTDIEDCEGLQGIRDTPGGSYRLVRDIDCSGTISWNGGEGFEPIALTGQLDGGGYKISGLYINRPEATGFVGLFSDMSSDSMVKGLGIENAIVVGNEKVGVLTGHSYGSISDSYVSGGSVSGINEAGGLVGRCHNCKVQRSYSSVSVEGAERIGGLVGHSVGLGASIKDSYALGHAYGESEVGGLVGKVGNDVEVRYCYSTGIVTGTEYLGGLIGHSTELVSDSYWDTETSSIATTGYGEGKTSAEMKDACTFASWSASVWGMAEYPCLRWESGCGLMDTESC
jgi:hypothetical protein